MEVKESRNRAGRSRKKKIIKNYELKKKPPETKP